MKAFLLGPDCSRPSSGFHSPAFRLPPRPRVRACAAALLLAAIFFLPACRTARGFQSVEPDRSLRIEAEVVNQSLCAGRAGVDFLHMRLRLRYANAGRRKLIVYRGNNLFFQVFVSPVGERPLGVPGYELKTTSARFLTKESEGIDAPAPNRDFVTLAPGAKFETELTVSLPVAREGTQRGVGAIASGGHVLRLRVSTWYESKALGEKLRERWRRAGLLWTDPVGTTAVRFDTEAAHATRGCPRTPAAD